MFFFCFLCFSQATILQLPRIFAKDEAPPAGVAGGAAEAAGARPAKPVAARVELEGEKRLPEGASWRWGELGDEACRMGGTGWYRQVTITEKEGGVERKSNLTLPSYVWVGGETAKWPNAAEEEAVAAFLCLFGMSDPPPKEKFFFVEGVFFVGGGVHWEGSVAEAAQGGGASSKLGGMTPPHPCWMPLPNGFGNVHPRGEGRESRRSGGLRWWLFRRMPPPHRGKGPTPSPKPSPKPSKVAKVAAQPPPEALDLEALGASVATLVTDAC